MGLLLARASLLRWLLEAWQRCLVVLVVNPLAVVAVLAELPELTQPHRSVVRATVTASSALAVRQWTVITRVLMSAFAASSDRSRYVLAMLN